MLQWSVIWFYCVYGASVCFYNAPNSALSDLCSKELLTVKIFNAFIPNFASFICILSILFFENNAFRVVVRALFKPQ